MNDRELLELAAKAAVIIGDYCSFYERDYYCCGNSSGIVTTINGKEYVWNPLDDDGDALRLAVKLSLCFETRPDANGVFVWNNHYRPTDLDIRVWGYASEAGSMEAAARLTMVRAAAEIGKSL